MSEEPDSKLQPAALFAVYEEHYMGIKKIFDEVAKTRVMELLRDNQERAKYLLNYHCKVIACPASHLILNHDLLLESQFKVGTIIFLEAGQITDFETFSAIMVTRGLKRIVMVGDQKQSPPQVVNKTLETKAKLSSSMFSRLLKLGHKTVRLDHQGKSRPDIFECIRWCYPNVSDLPSVKQDEQYQADCPGLKYHCQIVDVQGQEVIQSLI